MRRIDHGTSGKGLPKRAAEAAIKRSVHPAPVPAVFKSPIGPSAPSRPTTHVHRRTVLPGPRDVNIRTRDQLNERVFGAPVGMFQHPPPPRRFVKNVDTKIKRVNNVRSVSGLQKELNRAGYRVAVDNAYGPETDAAWKHYQQKLNKASKMHQ